MSFTRELPAQFLQGQFYFKFNVFMQTDVAMFPCTLPCYLCEVPSIDHAKDSQHLEQLGLNADIIVSAAEKITYSVMQGQDQRANWGS